MFNKLKYIIVTFVCLVLFNTNSYSEESELKKYLRQFIEIHCCFTNDCCWEIEEKEVTPLGNNIYRINSTGQEVKVQGYSPDGKYWRCACDFKKGTWVKHEHAETRCLYIPHRGY